MATSWEPAPLEPTGIDTEQAVVQFPGEALRAGRLVARGTMARTSSTRWRLRPCRLQNASPGILESAVTRLERTTSEVETSLPRLIALKVWRSSTTMAKPLLGLDTTPFPTEKRPERPSSAIPVTTEAALRVACLGSRTSAAAEEDAMRAGSAICLATDPTIWPALPWPSERMGASTTKVLLPARLSHPSIREVATSSIPTPSAIAWCKTSRIASLPLARPSTTSTLQSGRR